MSKIYVPLVTAASFWLRNLTLVSGHKNRQIRCVYLPKISNGIRILFSQYVTTWMSNTLSIVLPVLYPHVRKTFHYLFIYI